MMFRSALLWVCFFFIIGVVLLFTIGGASDSYRNAGYTALVSSSHLFFLYFAGMILAVGSSRRERIEATDVLRETLPYSSARWLLGRWLALLLPFTLLSWYPLFLFIGGMFPNVLAPGTGTGILYLASLAVPMWFVASIGFFIGDRIPGRWSYLIAILFYIAFAYGIHLFIMGRPSSGIVLFDLAGYVHLFEGSDFSLFRGYYTDSQHWLHRLFYLGIAIVISMGTLLKHTRKRKERGVPYYAAAGVVALLLVLVIPGIYFATAERRYAAARQVEKDYALYAEAANTPAKITPIGYRMKMGFGPYGKLKMSTVMEAQATDGTVNEIELYLDRLFEVKTVLHNGNPVGWEEGAIPGSIRIKSQYPFENAFELAIDYEGKVVQWTTAPGIYGGDKVVRRAFASSRELLLPDNMVWYPMTAAQLPKPAVAPGTGRDPYEQRERENSPAIRYEMEITNAKSMQIVSSDYIDASSTKPAGNRMTTIKAQSREPLALIGGPFKLVQASGEYTDVILVVSTLANKTVAEQTVANTAKLLDRAYVFFDRTRALHQLPVYIPDKVTLMPIHSGQGPIGIRDQHQQLNKVKATTHLQNGWVEVDESYPSGFEASQWALLWQWLESVETEHTANAPLKQFYHLLKEYVMSDAEPPLRREMGGMMFRYERIYKYLGRERFEQFIWDFYRQSIEIGRQFERGNSNSDSPRETRNQISRQILQYLISREGPR
jgi:hypothetical protein